MPKPQCSFSKHLLTDLCGHRAEDGWLWTHWSFLEKLSGGYDIGLHTGPAHLQRVKVYEGRVEVFLEWVACSPKRRRGPEADSLQTAVWDTSSVPSLERYYEVTRSETL